MAKKKRAPKRRKIGFKMAARGSSRRLLRQKKITRVQHGQLLMKLRDPEAVEELENMCRAQAVECGVMSLDEANSSEPADWVGFGENIDWKKLSEFFMKILPLILI